jgi:hypothetical protein
MVDLYHLFKLGAAAGKIIKVTGSVGSAKVILKHIAKPMVVMGLSGVADAACEDATDLIIKKIEETK